MRTHWLLPVFVFAVVLAVTAGGLSLPAFDRLGSYLMVAAALALAVILISRRKPPGR